MTSARDGRAVGRPVQAQVAGDSPGRRHTPGQVSAGVWSGVLQPAVPPQTIPATAAVFGVFSLLLALVVYLIVPWLAAAFGVPGLVAWYVAGTLVVLLPMLVFAVLMARRETASGGLLALALRLRLGRLSGADVAWAFGGTLAAVLLTGAIAAVARVVDPAFVAGPPFLRDSAGWPVPWLLVAWLPLYVSNILGEELCWRGYLLPRQEAVSGRATGLLNGLFWCLFHWSFGWQIMLLTLPLALVLPAVVQRRRNTWIGILIHGVFNAGGFAAVLAGVGAA